MLLNMALSSKESELRKGIVRKNSIWDSLVFKKIQDGMGGRLRLMVVGSAPLAGSVLTFARCALGCLIVEGYGQTECCAPVTLTVQVIRFLCNFFHWTYSWYSEIIKEEKKSISKITWNKKKTNFFLQNSMKMPFSKRKAIWILLCVEYVSIQSINIFAKNRSSIDNFQKIWLHCSSAISSSRN